MKGTTIKGFNYEIQDDKLNDMRVMDALMELDEVEEGNEANAIFAMSKVATLLLGKKQKEELYKFIEKEHGRVDMEEFMTIMAEILTSKEEPKN